MAMSDLQVFQEYAYSSRREVLDYNINLFNAATAGGLILRNGDHMGDFSDEAFWATLSGIIRRRNPRTNNAVSEINLSMLLATSVRVGTGTNPIRLDPAWMRWIGKSPEEAGIKFGESLAQDTMLDMVNTSVGALLAAMANTGGKMNVDATTIGDGTMSHRALVRGGAAYGDAMGNLACWVMHSTPWFDLLGNNLENTEQLFQFGTVVVKTDPLGRPFVITDLPSLHHAAGADPVADPERFFSLGLTPGAVVIEENPDFDQNLDTKNGTENLVRTWQSEWSYNLGVKSFTWDKTNGGAAPTNAALQTAANWDRVAQHDKSLPAVILKTK